MPPNPIIPRIRSAEVSLETNQPIANERLASRDTRSIIACVLGTLILRSASAVAGSTIQFYFGYIDRNLYPLSDTMRGFALALFFLPELIGSPILGAWSDRRGRKFFMALGALLGVLGTQITAMTTNFEILTLARLLGGLSTASAFPATLGYLSAITSHSEPLRARVLGLFQIATLAGTIVGIFFGGRLWDNYASRAFTIDALIYAASLVVFLVGIHERRFAKLSSPSTVSVDGTSLAALRRTLAYYRSVFFSPTILRFAPAWIAMNMVLGIWLNHLVSQLVSPPGEFPGQLLFGILANSKRAGNLISTYATILFVIFGLGVAIWSFVLGRLHRTDVMLIATSGLFVLCGVLFLLNHTASLSAPIVPLYLLLATLALLAVSGLMPAALTYLADVTEEDSGDRGAIMGLYTIFLGLGGFLGTVVGGPAADVAAIDGILVATVVLSIIITGALFRLHRIEARPPAFKRILTKER